MDVERATHPMGRSPPPHPPAQKSLDLGLPGLPQTLGDKVGLGLRDDPTRLLAGCSGNAGPVDGWKELPQRWRVAGPHELG